MFDYSSLQFDEELQNILEEQLINTDYDLLRFLEMYKFYNREEILDFLRKCSRGEVYTSLEPEIKNNIRKIGAYLVIEETPGYYEVISTVDQQLNLPAIELQLGSTNVSVIYVTPVNYHQLSDLPLPKYDPIILLKRIILEALRRKATDLHFEVKHYTVKPEYHISVRVNGDLIPMDLFELDANLNKQIIHALVEQKTTSNGLDLTESAGVVTSSSNLLKTLDAELRIAADKVLGGYHYVMRVQRKDTLTFTIDKLGFQNDTVRALREIVQKRSGITLITGAMRTGKNTTAFAIMNEMVKEPVKIVSYESPVEVLMPFTQMDYREDEHILANAIRLAKKQDVNIAFVNEIPNREVAFAVQDLVNSSVHVITTMHVHRIWHLPYKLKEYYGEAFKDVISQINTVFNQKMFGVSCPHCQDVILTDSVQEDRPRKILKQYGINSINISRGCHHCDNTGVTPGKNQPYVEYLEFTDEVISDLLRCNAPYEMELVIRKYMTGRELTQMLAFAVADGKLPLNALNFV